MNASLNKGFVLTEEAPGFISISPIFLAHYFESLGLVVKSGSPSVKHIARKTYDA